MQLNRLFDILPYQKEKYPQKVSIAGKYGGRWQSYTTAEFLEKVTELSAHLLKLGIEKGENVALVFSNNRPEWNLLDLALLQIGAVVVPMYPTISEAEYLHIFNEIQLRFCFVSDAELCEKVNTVKHQTSIDFRVFSVDAVAGVDNVDELSGEIETSYFDAVEEIKNSIEREDLATIIYTSGTTGLPKGVMLSHRNIMSNIKMVLTVLPLSAGDRVLSFLPLCHIFERTVTYVYMTCGASIYYAESIDRLRANIQEVKPHYFTAVPRILEKVYDALIARGKRLKGWQRKIFFWAMRVGMNYDVNVRNKILARARLKLADWMVFSKWKQRLGGEVKGIAVGAAALQPQLARLFNAVGMTIREGYGLTETSPVLAFNRFEPAGSRVGTVGIPVPGVEIKLADDNEILARGPNIMLGYYKQPEETEKVLNEDGWLHTGDIGSFDGKFLSITDRKKELFKTSGGKYVAPQPIENRLKASDYVQQAIVVGDNRRFASALIVPSFDLLASYCEDNEVRAMEIEKTLRERKVIQLFQYIVDEVNKELGKTAQIKKFALIPTEWTWERDELTPTLKLKRNNIERHYSAVINQLYSD